MGIFSNLRSMTVNSAAVLEDPRNSDHRDRAEKFNRAMAYYKSEHDPQLKTKKGGPEHNVRENWYRSIIDDLVSFLVGGGVSFETESKAIEEFWADNPITGFSAEHFAIECALNGALFGTTFARVMQVGDTYRPFVVNPADVDILPEGGYDIIWQEGKQWKRHRIQPKEEGLGWETVESRLVSNGEWQEVETFPWDYEFPPMVHRHNLILPNSVYGMADIPDVNNQDSINRVMSSMNKTVYYHSHPTPFMRGFSAGEAQQMDVGPGKAIVVSNPDAQMDLLEMQSDMSAARNMRGDIVNAMHQTNGATRNDPETISNGALSGFAIQLMFQKMISTTERKRITYGGVFDYLNAVAQVLGGETVEPVKVIWPDMIPSNPSERAANFGIYAQYLDIEQAAIRAGFSEDEAAAMAENETDGLADG